MGGTVSLPTNNPASAAARFNALNVQGQNGGAAGNAVANALKTAGIDTKSVPDAVLNSPDLKKALDDKGLTSLQPGDTAGKRAVQSLVSEMTTKHLNSKKDAAVDLSDPQALQKVTSSLLGQINRDPKLAESTKPLQDKLKATLESPNLFGEEKMAAASDILKEITGKVKAYTAPAVSNPTTLLDGLSSYLGQAKLASTVNADVRNAADEMAGVKIDTGSRDKKLKSAMFDLAKIDPEGSKQLKANLDKISGDSTLTHKEQSGKIASALEQFAGAGTHPTIKGMKKLAAEIRTEASDVKITDKQSKEIKETSKEVSTALTKALIQGHTASDVEGAKASLKMIELYAGNDQISDQRKADGIKSELTHLANDPILNTESNQKLKAKIESLAEGLGSPDKSNAKPLEASLGLYNNVKITPGANGALPTVEGNLSQSVAGGKITASKTPDSFKAEITSPPIMTPVGPMNVALAGSIGGSSAKQDDGTVKQSGNFSVNPNVKGVGAPPGKGATDGVNVGVKIDYSKETTFQSMQQVAENIPTDPAAEKAARQLPGSKLSNETIKTLKTDAESLNRARDETAVLSAALQKAGAIDGELKMPEGYSTKAADQKTTMGASIDANHKAGGKVTAGGSLGVVNTHQTTAGDKVDFLQKNEAAMEASLKKHNLGDVAALLEDSKTTSTGTAADIEVREDKKAQIKQMILDNLNDQREYVDTMRKTADHKGGAPLVGGVKNSVIANLQNSMAAEAGQKKSGIEDKLGTASMFGGNETRTLDKMLVKHTALTQAYNNLSGSQPAGADDDFQALMKSASNEMMSPDVSVKRETLKQLQMASRDTSTTEIDAKVTVGKVNVDAKVEVKPLENKNAEREVTVKLDAKNLTNLGLSSAVGAIASHVNKGGADSATKAENETSARTAADLVKDNYMDNSTLEVGLKGGKVDSLKASTEHTIKIANDSSDIDKKGAATYSNVQVSVAYDAKNTEDDNGQKEWKGTQTFKLSGNLKLSPGNADALISKMGIKDEKTAADVKSSLTLSGDNASVELQREGGEFKSLKVANNTSVTVGSHVVDAGIAFSKTAEKDDSGATKEKSETTVTLKLTQIMDQKTLDAVAKNMDDKFGTDMQGNVELPKQGSDQVKGKKVLGEVEFKQGDDGKWTTTIK